jgi:hypothetical protein
MSASIPAGRHFVVEPYLGFFGSLYMKANYEENMGIMGSFSLHYKFGKKPR